MKKVLVMSVSLVALFAASSVYAKCPCKGQKDCGCGKWNLIAKADKDNDGAISKEEYKTYFENKKQKINEKKAEKFEKLDANKDGKLSKDEFMNGPKTAEKAFAEKDTNGDGKITDDELKSKRNGKKSWWKFWGSDETKTDEKTEVKEEKTK